MDPLDEMRGPVSLQRSISNGILTPSDERRSGVRRLTAPIWIVLRP